MSEIITYEFEPGLKEKMDAFEERVDKFVKMILDDYFHIPKFEFDLLSNNPNADQLNSVKIHYMLSELLKLSEYRIGNINNKYRLVIKDSARHSNLQLWYDLEGLLGADYDKYLGKDKDRLTDVQKNNGQALSFVDYGFMQSMKQIFDHLRIPSHAACGYIITEMGMFSDIVNIKFNIER